MRVRGVLLMLAAVGVFSVMDALMKQLSGRYPAIQIACLRGAASLPFVLLTYAWTRELRWLKPVRFGLHLLRAALAVLMLWGFLWALARASMADTYAVFMCAPLLVVLVASLLLGERVNLHHWLAILTGLGGVFVMLRPSLEGLASLAGLATLGSALAYAVIVVLVRVLARTDTTASMVFWYLLMLAIGLTGWAGQYLITEAFRLAPASLVAPYEYTALVWAVGLDWAIWQVLPGARMLAGSAIVVAAGLYLLHRERMKAA